MEGWLLIASGILMIFIGLMIMSTLPIAGWMGRFAILNGGIALIGIGLSLITGDNKYAKNASNINIFLGVSLINAATGGCSTFFYFRCVRGYCIVLIWKYK
jgi:hypothetical protein